MPSNDPCRFSASCPLPYSKLSDEGKQVLFARTTQPGFTGLTLEQTGYETWEELGQAVVDSQWEKMPGTADWAMFPEVDSLTGAFDQTITLDARSLGSAYMYGGMQVGFQRGRWGF